MALSFVRFVHVSVCEWLAAWSVFGFGSLFPLPSHDAEREGIAEAGAVAQAEGQRWYGCNPITTTIFAFVGLIIKLELRSPFSAPPLPPLPVTIPVPF